MPPRLLLISETGQSGAAWLLAYQPSTCTALDTKSRLGNLIGARLYTQYLYTGDVWQRGSSVSTATPLAEPHLNPPPEAQILISAPGRCTHRAPRLHFSTAEQYVLLLFGSTQTPRRQH